MRLLTRMRFLIPDGAKRYGDQLELLQLEFVGVRANSPGRERTPSREPDPRGENR